MMEIIESPFTQIIQDLVTNAKYITPELQKAIAQYINYQTTPINIRLDESDIASLKDLDPMPKDYKKGKK